MSQKQLLLNMIQIYEDGTIMQIPEGFNIKSAYVTKTIIILNMHDIDIMKR